MKAGKSKLELEVLALLSDSGVLRLQTDDFRVQVNGRTSEEPSLKFATMNFSYTEVALHTQNVVRKFVREAAIVAVDRWLDGVFGLAEPKGDE